MYLHNGHTAYKVRYVEEPDFTTLFTDITIQVHNTTTTSSEITTKFLSLVISLAGQGN